MLITLDLDFADIRAYPPGTHPGIVVLRPRNQVVTTITALVPTLLGHLTVEAVQGSLWIVDESGIRVRSAETGDP